MEEKANTHAQEEYSQWQPHYFYHFSSSSAANWRSPQIRGQEANATEAFFEDLLAGELEVMFWIVSKNDYRKEFNYGITYFPVLYKMTITSEERRAKASLRFWIRFAMRVIISVTY